jgi:hypothetical protein
MDRDQRLSTDKVFALEKTIQTMASDLTGYTRYTDYLSVGKKTLSEQAKFLAATVTRKDQDLETLQRSFLWFSSEAAVAVWYTAEYSFGYDLRPESYDLAATDSGIEIRLNRPTLVATPAVKASTHEIFSRGFFTDEKLAVIAIHEGLAKRLKEQGDAMASDPEIVALCEKRLIAFLRDFLAKQPGVRIVPSITVAYRN